MRVATMVDGVRAVMLPVRGAFGWFAHFLTLGSARRRRADRCGGYFQSLCLCPCFFGGAD